MKPRPAVDRFVPRRQTRVARAGGTLGAARRRWAVALLAGVSLLLAACGAADSTPDATQASDPATSPTARSGQSGATATTAATAPSSAGATPTAAQAQEATPAPTRTPTARPVTTPTPLPPPAPAIGDSVQTEGWVFSVSDYETMQRIGDHTASGMFLYLRMTITNSGSAAAAFPFDGLVVVDHEDRTFFLAKDATSETLEWDFGTAIDAPFNPGETRNVAVAFDIAVDSTALVLTSPSRVFEISIEHREPPK